MFKIHTTDDGRVPGIEYLPCTGEVQLQVGMLLTQTNGKLAVCTGTDVPQYIAMCEKESAEGELIPVIRVQKDMIFETECSASFTSVKLGNKVTIDATGTKLTATTTSGVAEIVYIDDTKIGSMVRCRF